MKNDVKKLTISAILLSIGFILHQVAPAGLGAVTFDYMIAILIIIVAINKDYKTAFIAGLAAGIISALTTKFPGGQIPNILDKIIASLVVCFIIRLLDNVPEKTKMAVIGFIGTIVSGSIFLGSASIIVGLPTGFTALFIGVVLPTAISNIFVCVFLYKIVTTSINRVNPTLLKQIQG